jgi:hypothetical protein
MENKPIEHYIVLTAYAPESLSALVNKYILMGFRPCGGLQVLPNSDREVIAGRTSYQLCQSVIKYAE